MSTFNPPADIAQITLAKSSDVNAIKAATGIAFALLPNETKLQRGTVNFNVDTGTANAYAVALDASIITYTDGLQVVFRPLNTNTGVSTLNLNGIGIRSIRLTDSNPIQAGDISAGAIIDVRYSTATGFFHLTPNSAIYAHDAGVSAAAAGSSANASAGSASDALGYRNTAEGYKNAAGDSATAASSSAIASAGSASDALSYRNSAESYKNTAVSSATAASSSAIASALSASDSLSYRNTAEGYKNAAGDSAVAAGSSATAAAASYDSFDDRYLGAKASDPSVDNDGNALLTGALYWNSTSSVMKVYSGSAWITSYLPATGYLALSGGVMTGAITFAAAQFGTGVNTFLTTPSSANLLAAVTDETGTGKLVFATSPTLITPILGTPTSGDLSSCTNAVAYGLKSATTTVSVSTATAPTSGYVLTATSSTTATWQPLPAAGVTSITGTANQVIASVSTGAVTLSLPQSIATTSSVELGSLGIGTAASGTSGEIRATNNVTAYYSSDKKLKENIRSIPNALNIANAIGGKLFDWTDEYIDKKGGADGYFIRKSDFGVIAQDVEKVLDVAVRTREDGTLAVDYEKLVAVAFEAIKELTLRIQELENN